MSVNLWLSWSTGCQKVWSSGHSQKYVRERLQMNHVSRSDHSVEGIIWQELTESCTNESLFCKWSPGNCYTRKICVAKDWGSRERLNELGRKAPIASQLLECKKWNANSKHWGDKEHKCIIGIRGEEKLPKEAILKNRSILASTGPINGWVTRCDIYYLPAHGSPMSGAPLHPVPMWPKVCGPGAYTSVPLWSFRLLCSKMLGQENPNHLLVWA